ncbi:breast cancer type 1 susceptibility protein [Elgaria multicarinata webbii]|uniref:breast cancer type 1 susceptibility protein n=1 Tax=Elgaria multicarinata webbii TaxID=159646 RepID=UPI002FCD5C9A
MDSSVPTVTEVHGMLLALQKNLECPICLEVMKEPVSTNCAHNFCRFCTYKLLKQKKGVTQCPLCNAKVTKRSLREDVRFKQVIKVVLETIHAYERDTGLKFDCCSPKKVSASVPWKEKTVIDSKGYRDRLKRRKEGIKGNTTLGESSSFPLCNRTVARYTLRKKSNSSKAIFFEIGSDSSEAAFKKAGAISCSRNNSLSQVGEPCAKNRSLSPCHVEHPEPIAEDWASLHILGTCGFSEEGLGSTEGTPASPENIEVVEESMAVERSQGLFFPDLSMEQDTRKPDSSSRHEDDSCSLLSMVQLVGEATNLSADKQAGNGTERAGIGLPTGSAQNLCEDEEKLLHSHTSSDSPLSQVPRKRLKQSIQKVNEWFSKSKEVHSPSSLQDVLNEEVNQDPDPYLSDADSCVSQKTEQMEVQGKFTVGCEGDTFLSKPITSKIQDKIFRRTYKRKCNSAPLWNKRETIQFQADKGTAVNTKSCDTPIKKSVTRKRKASDFVKRHDVTESSKRPGGDENSPLEVCDQALAVIDDRPVADLKEAEFSAVLVMEGVSILGADASEQPQSRYHKLPETNLKNLKKVNYLSKKSRPLSKSFGAPQVVRDRSSRSPENANIHVDDKEPRELRTGQMQVRRSRRLQLLTEEAWREDRGLQLQSGGARRRSEPAKIKRKQVDEGEKKQSWSQAGIMPTSSVAKDNPNVLQGELQKSISLSDTSLMGMDGNCVMGIAKGIPRTEHTTEGHSPCCIVPNVISQNSYSLLEFHPTEVEQTNSEDKQFLVAHQPENNALCAQSPKGDAFCTGDLTEICKYPEIDDKATEALELNPETDDSELGIGFMRKIFSGCKRQSFLLHQHPVKESATEIQRELNVGKMENSKVDCLKKSNQNRDRICEKRREAAVCVVNKGISVQKVASCTSYFSEHKDRAEHLQVASHVPFPDQPSLTMQSATENVEDGSQVQSQKPPTEESIYPEVDGGSASSNGGSSSSRIPSVGRNSNVQDAILTLVNKTSSSTPSFSQAGFEDVENSGLTLHSQPELMQTCHSICQSPLPESSCVHLEKKSSMEQKQMNSDIGKAIDNSSLGVPKCLFPRENVEQFSEEELHDFELLSETPEDLLGPPIKNKVASLNLWEMDRKDTLAMSAETEKQPLLAGEMDSDNRSSSKLKSKAHFSACKKQVQKLPSSEEENSSEDEELPCFQALIFGKSVSTPPQPMKKKDPSTELLAWKSNGISNLKCKVGDVSPSQESECSMNLFSSQSHASGDSSSKPHDSRQLTLALSSRKKLASLSWNKKTPQSMCKVSKDISQDEQQEYMISESNLGEETIGYDSEANHLGDYMGLSSQSEILTTQQRDAMQNNLKKLQQKMAVLEAVLKHGSQSVAPKGWSLPGKEVDFSGGQTRSAKGSKANLRSESKQSLLGAFSPTVKSMHRLSGSYSTSSSKPEEQISSCLAKEAAMGAAAVTHDIPGAPRHKVQGMPVSPLSTTTHCSTSKGNSKCPLLTSKRNMSLVASGLNQGELRLAQKFVGKTQSIWSNKITAETTHVVMKTDEDLVCERTLKYFLGIAAQKWVVSYQWIEQSLKAGTVLHEGDFEVRGDVINGRSHQGPKRARESSAGKLFQGLKICCYGPFTDMLPEQLEWMVELCGASLVKQRDLFAHATNSAAVIVVQPDAWAEDTVCQGFPPQCSATIVSREWVLDSVACYQRRPFDEYVVQQV